MTRRMRYFYSLLSGVILALGWAQWMNSLILLVALVPLLLVERSIYEERSVKKPVNIFYYSLITFGIWNSLSTWWIFNASPLGMAIAILLNTLLMSFVFYLFHASKRVLGERAGYILLVSYWIAFEYFNINWELSWSWLGLGNGFAKNISLIQWYEYTGIHGGTLWILGANISITLLVSGILKSLKKVEIVRNLITSLLWIMIPVSFSLYIYHSYTEKNNPYNIVIIQPNIDPYTEKFDGLSDDEQLDKILNLADSVATENTDYFVAPETALPKSIREEAIETHRHIKKLKQFIGKYDNSTFVIGLSSYKVYYSEEKPTSTAREIKRRKNAYYDNFNTAMQIDYSDDIQLYHKSKLVVGVEKMPFPKTLGFLEQFALEMGGTSGSLGIQDKRGVFKKYKDSISIAPVICYESIFGEYVGEYIQNGANMIFVITNDAWWGDTPGYRQHLRFSQLRAVETRRSVARSANTGTSCFINQRGDLIMPTLYEKDDAIISSLNANDKITFYTRYGNFLGRIFSFVSVLALLASISMYLRKKGNKTD